MSDTAFLVGGIVMTLLGGLSLFATISTIITCKCEVEAKITSLKYREKYWRGRASLQYTAELSYLVNGVSYEGKLVFSTPKSEFYRKGNQLKIRYNPKKPQMIHRKGDGAATSLLLGILLFGFGVFILVIYIFFILLL